MQANRGSLQLLSESFQSKWKNIMYVNTESTQVYYQVAKKAVTVIHLSTGSLKCKKCLKGIYELLLLHSH